MRPRMDANDLPRCAEDDCPSYDGKRCSQFGFRPGEFCEPALREMLSKPKPQVQRDTLELRVHRLVRSLHASSATIDVELTRMGLPLEYDPSPLESAIERLSVSVDAVREVLGQRLGQEVSDG